MGSTCSMVLIRVRPFLFARTMMTFHKILRITEHPCRADQSAIIGINLRTSPSTFVGARAMGSGGGGGGSPPPPPARPPPPRYYFSFYAPHGPAWRRQQSPLVCTLLFASS